MAPPLISTNMSGMFFAASSFDQPLSTWDISAVTDMKNMFLSASSFRQPLSTWNFTSIPHANAMNSAFSGSGMTDCELFASSKAEGLPNDISRFWTFSSCPSCPCKDTKLACLAGSCLPVNSGYLQFLGELQSNGSNNVLFNVSQFLCPP